MPGKTIKLYLVDGTADGTAIAELVNWTGKVFVAPRASFAAIRSRPELQRAGAYLLVGADPDEPDRTRVYVGEGSSLATRIPQHDDDADKEFADRVILITGKDDQLNKGHAAWLERRLIAMVRANGTAVLANGTNGAVRIPLSESDESDMEGFIEHVALVLPSLGYSFVTPPVRRVTAMPSGAPPLAVGMNTSAVVHDASPTFQFAVSGALGRMQVVGPDFFLLAGSTCVRQGRPAWTSYKALRDRLEAAGKLAVDANPALLRVVEDIALKSPSAAAVFVAGGNTNGRTAWRTPDGMTYAAWSASVNGVTLDVPEP